MFRSKGIGWITAGTLFCVAGVALACRLRDSGSTSAEASAAPSAEVKDEKDFIPTPPSLVERSAKENKVSGPSTLTEMKRPAVGELVTPDPATATGAAPDVEPPAVVVPEPVREPSAAPDVPASTPPGEQLERPPVTAIPAPGGVAPVAEVTPPPPASEAPAIPSPAEPSVPREPRANLGMPDTPPETPVIRPVAGKDDGTSGVTPASLPPTPRPESKVEEEGKPEPPTSVPPATRPVSPIPDTYKQGSSVPAPGPAAPLPPSPTISPVDAPAGTTPSAPIYKVKEKGETLRDIARRTLGSGDRWIEIYRLNSDLHPELIVPRGKEVRLPSDARADVGRYGPTGGEQAESEHAGPEKSAGSAVQPLPVVRSRPARGGKNVLPLTGTFSCRIERAKMVLPKEVSKQFGKTETMLLTPGPDNCLWLVTQAGAARVLERVEKSGAGDREVQAFRRLYFAQSEKASVGPGGHLVIPEKLVQYAGLTGDAVLIGIDDHFEVWDAFRWRRYSQQKDSSTQP